MERHSRYIALTGLPRSGSTLCCHLVNAAAQAVALFEPMQVHTLAADDRRHAVGQVLAYFDEMHASLLADGTAETRHRGGTVPDNPFGGLGDDGVRVRDIDHGRIRFDKTLSPDFLLMIKHNAAYAALLPELQDAVAVYGLVRNPMAMLASWNTISIPISQGRLPVAERIDGALREALDLAPDLIGRQLVVMDWFFARYRDHLPPERILRYEQITATHGRCLLDALGLDADAAMPLQERNANRLYANVDVDTLCRRLLACEGTWWQFYSRDEVEKVHERLARAR